MQQYQPKRIYLSDLVLKPTRDTICVRVMRKWIFDRNNPGSPIIYIGLVLADEKGDAMYAQIYQSDVPRLHPLVQENGTYLISKFNVKVPKTGYVPLDKELMINFTSFTVVVPVDNPPSTFPAYVYKITPFSNINAVGPAASKPIDVLGIITIVHSTRHIPLKQNERMATIRDVIIRDLSGADLKIRLWDEQATGFALPNTSATEQVHSIVALFVGCLPKIISNVMQVNGGNQCRWYFNPDIREALPLYDRLRLSPVPIHQELPLLTNADTMSKTIGYEHRTLAEIKKIDPYDFPEDGIKCTITITDVSQTNRWFYTGCAKCKKAPEIESVPFMCANKSCTCTQTTLLYKLAFRGKDDTDEADFFAYDYVSRRLIKKNIDFVIRQHKTSGSQLPQAITNVISKKFTLLVKPTRGSFDDIHRMVYEPIGVPVDFEEQALIERQLLLAQQPAQTVPIPALPAPADPTPQPTTEIVLAAATSTPPPTLQAHKTPNKDAEPGSSSQTKLAPKVLFPQLPATSEVPDVDISIGTITQQVDTDRSENQQIALPDVSTIHDTTTPQDEETDEHVDSQDHSHQQHHAIKRTRDEALHTPVKSKSRKSAGDGSQA